MNVWDAIEVTAVEFGLHPATLVQRGRTRRVAHARHWAMWLARRRTTATLPLLGRRFGGRHHSTIVHGVQTIERLVAADEDAALLAWRLLHAAAEHTLTLTPKERT